MYSWTNVHAKRILFTGLNDKFQLNLPLNKFINT